MTTITWVVLINISIILCNHNRRSIWKEGKLCIVNDITLFSLKNPEGKCSQLVVSKMIQPYLDYKADTAVVKEVWSSQSFVMMLKVKIPNNVRLVGKHYMLQRISLGGNVACVLTKSSML